MIFFRSIWTKPYRSLREEYKENREVERLPEEKLFLVFADVFEILVSIHFQFAAGGLVAGDDRVIVELERADGPGMIHAAFHTVLQSAGFIVTVDEEEHFAGIRNGSDADGERAGRYLGNIMVKEAGIRDDGVLCQVADAGTGIQ